MEVGLETKHGIVDEETLLILSKKLTYEWRDIGRHLTLPDSNLVELENNTKYGMLRKWKQLKGKDATYSKLIDALKKVDRPDLVIFVNKEKEKRFWGHPTNLQEAPCEPAAKKRKVVTTSETESEENFTNIPETLKLFVQELKQTYQRMVRTFRPVPYLNDSVNEVFVNTRLEELEEKAHPSEEDRWRPVGYCRDAILKNDAQRLLLIGNHGFGKSTLSLQMAYEWVTAVKGSPMSKIDILLFIRLQEVPDVKSVYRMIKLLLLPKGCNLQDMTIKEILEFPQLRVVLILDGLNKFSETNKESDIYSIIGGKLFPRAKVVITTSPEHTPSRFLGKHIKQMRMTGFDESIRYCYIRKAVSPSNSDHEEDKSLVKAFKEHYLLEGLCHVPLTFTMFVHLLKGNPELGKQKSITAFYDCMFNRFLNRMKNIDRVQMIESSHVTEDSFFCLQLGEIAFDGFDKNNPNLSWSKRHLVEKLGCDRYETYTTAGILIQDKIFHESIHDAQHFDEEPDIRVRFFDTSMQEYFAANYLVQQMKDIEAKHILSKYLNNFKPWDFRYFYPFACGLDDTVAKILIQFLLDNHWLDPAALCIMEIEDTNEVKDFFSTIIGYRVTIRATCDSSPIHLQRAKTFIVATASKFKIQVPSVELEDLFGSYNVNTGNFETKDGLYVPSLRSVKRLYLNDKGRVWTEDEFKRVLEYASCCDGLEILQFSRCMVPFDVFQEEDIPKASCKTLRVEWKTQNSLYLLQLLPFRWLPHILCTPALGDERTSQGGLPFDDFRRLDQYTYENIESVFHMIHSYCDSDSEWHKSHISTTPVSRNCVSNTTLTKLSQKIEGDWTAIAARLQINEFGRNGIGSGTDVTPQKKMYDTLKTWKDLNKEHASPQVLERALRGAAQDDVADELNAVVMEESHSLIAASTISKEGGTVQIDGVELHIPPNAFQEIQGQQRVQITVLPHHSLDEPAKCFEDNTTVMVQLLPTNLSLRRDAKLVLPHCLKLKNVVNSDVKIFRSYHKTGTKPLWEDVTTSISFTLLKAGCEIHLQRLCSIKYTISDNQVEAKRLKWYALGEKCKENAKYVTVDIGYHPDLPGENEVYRGQLRDKFLGDSQSFFFFKGTPPPYPTVSLVQVLPVWQQRPVTSVSMNIPRPLMVSNEQCCSFTFKRPRSSASLPRCVFEISGDPQQPKYRLNVNFRALQPPVENTKVATDDVLFYLSHRLGDTGENIGRRLQVNENDLQEIFKRDISHQLKVYLMLIKWKERVGEASFVEILIRVLNDEKTGLEKELPASLMDGAASNRVKENLILPDRCSLMASSDVCVDGGEILISGTDIELNILPDSFQDPSEKHEIQLKILPERVFQEPANCFEAYSTTIVELLPNDLRLKRPASLFLPHCLKLKSAKYCEVRIFQSHHTEDENPLWEDVTTTLDYTLSECNCEIKIKRFGWIKYTLRGTQVGAKKLILYALGENCDRNAKYVTVDVGYHLDLPGHGDIIQDKLKDKFLGNSKQFMCFKEQREDLKVKFMEANPKWRLANNPELPKNISFLSIASSVEQSCLFKFQRHHHTSNLPTCVFEISQGKQPVRENITITFTSQTPDSKLAEERLLKTSVLQHPQTTDSKLPEDRVVKTSVLHDLSSKIGSHWKDIGRRLDMPDPCLDCISERHGSLKERSYQMLIAWKQREGRSAKIGKLDTAFRACYRVDLADILSSGENEEAFI